MEPYSLLSTCFADLQVMEAAPSAAGLANVWAQLAELIVRWQWDQAADDVLCSLITRAVQLTAALEGDDNDACNVLQVWNVFALWSGPKFHMTPSL